MPSENNNDRFGQLLILVIGSAAVLTLGIVFYTGEGVMPLLFFVAVGLVSLYYGIKKKK